MYPDFDSSKVWEYREGNLFVVAYDPATRKPAWTGTLWSVPIKPEANRAKLRSWLKELVDDLHPS